MALVQPKKVSFSDNAKIYTTYSPSEYDRRMIDSTLYLKAYRRISDVEWIKILEDLNTYKKNEMQVHQNSKIYTSFYDINSYLL